MSNPTPQPSKAKNPAAVALGRLGGLKGGKAVQAGKTPQERSEAARRASRARWDRRQGIKDSGIPF